MPTPQWGGRLSRSDRLLRSRDFQRVARQGVRVASRDFVLLVAPALVLGSGASRGSRPVRRLGVTASRKVGNAVTRNRVKRAVREWFRTNRHRFDEVYRREGIDVVVIARTSAGALGGSEIQRHLRGLAARLEAPAPSEPAC